MTVSSKMKVKDFCIQYLSSFSLAVLVSSRSGKLSWAATTVLLLEVVPKINHMLRSLLTED